MRVDKKLNVALAAEKSGVANFAWYFWTRQGENYLKTCITHVNKIDHFWVRVCRSGPGKNAQNAPKIDISVFGLKCFQTPSSDHFESQKIEYKRQHSP